MNKWKQSGLLDLAGLLFWHELDDSTDGSFVSDYSGNGRELVGVSNLPALQSNKINSLPALYFNGATTAPLNFTEDLTVKHVFILAAIDGATFAGNEGLLSDLSVRGILLGAGASATKWFDLGYDIYGYVYRKNNVAFAEDNQAAPIGGNFALIELVFPNGLDLDGWQIGQDRSDMSRKFKGWFASDMAFSRILTKEERYRVMLYYSMKFAVHKLGVPLFFPSQDMLDFKASRIYAAPPDYPKITESVEFQDGGKSFNEVSDEPAQRWEYNYLNRKADGELVRQIAIFDEFYKTVRLTVPFYFRDKYGTVHNNVRVEKYSRNHRDHKSWKMDAEFDLIRYPNPDTSLPFDETAPVVSISHVLDSQYLVSGTDANGIYSVGITVDGVIYDEAFSNGYTFEIDTNLFDEGSYTVQGFARDTAGNIGYSNTLNLEIVKYSFVDSDGAFLVDGDSASLIEG